jgi:hypothetical protein
MTPLRGNQFNFAQPAFHHTQEVDFNLRTILSL